jgi:hypothetical protein
MNKIILFRNWFNKKLCRWFGHKWEKPNQASDGFQIWYEQCCIRKGCPVFRQGQLDNMITINPEDYFKEIIK